jgi:hypothetical protein
MTAVPGVPVTGLIVPQDSADTYPVTDPRYQLGGWRTELLLVDRDAIPAERRRRGMQVYVAETDLIYYLAANLTTWVAFSSTVSPHTHPISDIVGLQAALDLKAPLASPTFTGTPAVPTAAPGTNTTQAASTGFVAAGLATLVDSAPTNLNTLGKLATAVGSDAAFATTVSTALGLKAPLASPAFSGVPTVPTAGVGTNTTQAASCAFVLANAVSGGVYAPLASPAFTGVPTAPTATLGTATNQLATALFVANALAALVGTAPGNLDTLGEVATELGLKQPLAAALTALGALVPAVDQLAYFSGPTTAALTTATATGRGVLARTNSNTLRNYVDRGVLALTDGATIGGDDSGANVFSVTIAGNRTLSVPANLQAGASYLFAITNDATAGRTLTLASGFKFPSGVTWNPDTGAGKTNVLTCVCIDGTNLLCVPTVGY